MAKILIVDDIQGIHEMMDLIFADSGVELLHAISAANAIDQFKKTGVDVVVSDIQMPEMSGLELFSELRKLDPNLVCIMMTAADSKDFVLKALRLGAFDYIEKPFEEAVFVELVNRAIVEREQRRAGHPPSNNSPSRSSDDEVKTLRAALAARERQNQALELREKELLQHRNDLEVKESALKAMEAVVQEKLASLQQYSLQTTRQLPTETQQELLRLKAELEQKEAELEETLINLNEREAFLQSSEESLLEKSQRLTEIEAELEQRQEELSIQLNDAPEASRTISTEERSPSATSNAELEAKEADLSALERDLKKRKLAVRKAEMLLKAREEFVSKSENMLLGEDSET